MDDRPVDAAVTGAEEALKPAVTATRLTTKPFDYKDSTSFNFVTSGQTFDSLGRQTTVSVYFVKSQNPGKWRVFAGPSGIAPTDLGSMTFDSSGRLALTADPDGNAITPMGKFRLAIPNTVGASPQIVTLDLSRTTQLGSHASGHSGGSSTVRSAPTQDGFGASRLASYSISGDGTITGTYSDGRKAALGQVLLANFANPHNLQHLGRNQFAQTSESGDARVGVPGTSNLGSIWGNAIESSNVGLPGSLVGLAPRGATAKRTHKRSKRSRSSTKH
jgi:flagellar hook protein FlgE